ncbi:unnamed protein product, partial [Allacma fusca]
LFETHFFVWRQCWNMKKNYGLAGTFSRNFCIIKGYELRDRAESQGIPKKSNKIYVASELL